MHPGLAGGLMPDRRQAQPGIAVHAELHETEAILHLHRAIEGDAVELVLIDISEEIVRGHRCAFGIERDDEDRKSSVSGKRVSGRVKLGGRRKIKKKKKRK